MHYDCFALVAHRQFPHVASTLLGLIRFSSIPKPRPAPQAAAATAAPQARLRMQQEQQASIRNRRLAQQMANRPAVQAALKIKKVS